MVGTFNYNLMLQGMKTNYSEGFAFTVWKNRANLAQQLGAPAVMNDPATVDRSEVMLPSGGGRWPSKQAEYDRIEREVAERTGSAWRGWLAGQVIAPVRIESVPLAGRLAAGWLVLLAIRLVTDSPVPSLSLPLVWAGLSLYWHGRHVPGAAGTLSHRLGSAFSFEKLTITAMSGAMLGASGVWQQPWHAGNALMLVASMLLPHLLINLVSGVEAWRRQRAARIVVDPATVSVQQFHQRLLSFERTAEQP